MATRATKKRATENKNVEAKTEELTMIQKLAAVNGAKETEVETDAGVVMVKSRVKLADEIILINRIVDDCTESGTGIARWDLFDRMCKMVICAGFCDAEMPTDIETVFAAVCGDNGLYSKIEGFIDSDQLSNILKSAADMLEARERLNCTVAAKKLDEFINSVNELMQFVQDASEGFDAEEVVKAMNSITTLGKNI